MLFLFPEWRGSLVLRVLIHNRTYERGVSFNTFDNRDAADFSLTLNYKHKGYQSTRRSRTFLCGTDQNDYSDFALNWLIDELVDDGDEIVCLRAVEKDSRMASDAGIEEGKYRQEAERLFEQVIQKNSHDEKAISLVLELVVGKVEEIIQRMVSFYRCEVMSDAQEHLLTEPRFVFTSRSCSLSEPEVEISKAFTVSYRGPSPNTVSNTHQSPSSSFDPRPSARKKRRSVVQTQPDAATIISLS